MTRKALTALSVAGLFAAMTAWALHQQASYVISSLMCGRGTFTIWLVSGLSLVLLAAGAFGSAAYKSRAREGAEPADRAQPRQFLTVVSLLAAALFLFALLLQFAATFFMPSCLG